MKHNFLVFVALVFQACSSHSVPKEKSYSEKVNELDSLNKAATESFSQKNSSMNHWNDSLNYTYQYQKDLTGKSITFNGSILDVFKDGTDYVLKVLGDNYYNDFVAEIVVDSLRFNQFENLLNSNSHKELTGSFILHVNGIRSLSPKLSSDIEEDGELAADASSHLTYDWGRVTEFKGSFIAFQPYKTLPDDQ